MCLTTSTTLHRIHTTCTNHYSLSSLIPIQLHQLYNPTTVKVKVKVKFTLEQATKAQKGSRGTALISFFNLGTRWGWMVNTTPWPLDPQKGELVPIMQEAGWAPEPVWTGAEISPPPRFHLRTVQPVASHPTDCAIPVPILRLYLFIFSWYSQCENRAVLVRLPA